MKKALLVCSALFLLASCSGPSSSAAPSSSAPAESTSIPSESSVPAGSTESSLIPSSDPAGSSEQSDLEIWLASKDAKDYDGDGKIDAVDFEIYKAYIAWLDSDDAMDYTAIAASIMMTMPSMPATRRGGLAMMRLTLLAMARLASRTIKSTLLMSFGPKVTSPRT